MNLDDNPYVAPRPIDPREGRVKPGTIPPGGDEGPPVVVRFQITAEEIATAHREHARHLSLLWLLMIILHVVVIGLSSFFVLFEAVDLAVRMREGHTSLDRYMDPGLIGFCLMGISWFTLRRPINRQHLRRAVQRLAGDVDVEWRIQADRLESNAKLLRAPGSHAPIESIARPAIDWGNFIGGARTERGILLSLSPTLFHWLPRHGFADENGYERVARWACDRIRKFVDTTRR